MDRFDRYNIDRTDRDLAILLSQPVQELNYHTGLIVVVSFKTR